MTTVPERFNLAAYCLAPAPSRPGGKKALVIYSDVGAAPQTWTFAALYDQVRRIGGGLAAAGVRRGDRILLRMDNCAEYALTYFAAIGAGMVPIPASSLLTTDETAFLLRDSGAAAMALSPDMSAPPLPAGMVVIEQGAIAAMARSERAADFADMAADDPAYLVYTSGTTACPKGVLHAHRAAWGRRPMHDGWYGISGTDIVLHAGSFNWTYTIGTGLTDPWSRGATAVVYTGEKDPAVWPRLIANSGATLFAAVPTLFRQILKYAPPGPIDLAALRHGLSAGESLPIDVAAEWQMRTGTHLYEAFGMSEISTYISTPAGTVPKPGSPGRPQAGRRVALLPQDGAGTQPLGVGELGVIAVHRSDPGMMLGYWKRQDEEARMWRGDWFITGDLAHMDADGDFHLAGRGDDMMNARGYRVSPVEVEAVLAAFADVQEVGVSACEVRANVNIVVAFVVWRDKPAAGALLDYARSRLAAYKVPGEVISLSALPRTPNGKIRRRALASLRTAKNKCS